DPLTLPLFGGTPVSALTDSATPATASDVDQTAMEQALAQIVTCVNTGDPAQVWAVFSPHWFVETFADPSVHYLPAFEQMIDGPVEVPEMPLTLDSIDEIDPRNDGRVNVTATFRSGDVTWTDTLTLVMIDGAWLIDAMQEETALP